MAFIHKARTVALMLVVAIGLIPSLGSAQESTPVVNPSPENTPPAIDTPDPISADTPVSGAAYVPPSFTVEVVEGPIVVTAPISEGDYINFTIRITNTSDTTLYPDLYATGFDAYWFVTSPNMTEILPGQSVDIPAHHPIAQAQADDCNDGGYITPYSTVTWQLYDSDGVYPGEPGYPYPSYAFLTLAIDCRPLAPTSTPTATLVPTETPTTEPTATETTVPTSTATSEPTATSTSTSEPTATDVPTETPTIDPTATSTRQPTATTTMAPTSTATTTATVVPTGTATTTATVVPTGTAPTEPTATSPAANPGPTKTPVKTVAVNALPSTGTGAGTPGSTSLVLMLAASLLAGTALLATRRTHRRR